MSKMSQAAKLMGQCRSEAKAAAARENGKSGGRPASTKITFDVRMPYDLRDQASAAAGAHIMVPQRIARRLARAMAHSIKTEDEQRLLDRFQPVIDQAAKARGGEFAGWGFGVLITYPSGQTYYDGGGYE